MASTLPSDPAEHKQNQNPRCHAAALRVIMRTMAQETFSCYSCKASVTVIDGRVGRSETCDKCGADLHVCYNCQHYDSAVYNECREPMADRVVDKDRRNFCDYFLPGGAGKSEKTGKSDTLKKLDDLFK